MHYYNVYVRDINTRKVCDVTLCLKRRNIRTASHTVCLIIVYLTPMKTTCCPVKLEPSEFVLFSFLDYS